mmetsp:Transcript_16931/g.22055  ORF Transcript_16931/g.22055 Transcript_16931/m.22055 type:complete len:88 (+) Transcript_16931:220-483(+)
MWEMRRHSEEEENLIDAARQHFLTEYEIRFYLICFHREPFFRAPRDNSDQLGKIIECLGTSDLIDLITYAVKYNINMQLPTEVQRLL